MKLNSSCLMVKSAALASHHSHRVNVFRNSLHLPGKCIFLSGLTDQQLSYMHDQSLPEKYGIGFTNMVERTTPGSKDLSK